MIFFFSWYIFYRSSRDHSRDLLPLSPVVNLHWAFSVPRTDSTNTDGESCVLLLNSDNLKTVRRLTLLFLRCKPCVCQMHNLITTPRKGQNTHYMPGSDPISAA